MFKSKTRAIAIPQAEHLKLVGALAHLWGNADFDHPPVEHASLVLGISQHDRGYGVLDAWPVGSMPEEEWLGIARRGFEAVTSDPLADLITRHHIRRLARNNPSDAVQALYRAFDAELAAQLQAGGHSVELFERIDRITNLCDSISFSFCFDAPAEGQIAIFPRNSAATEVGVHYAVADGRIHVAPWPFSLETYESYILGYRLPDYPARLDPILMSFTLSQAG